MAFAVTIYVPTEYSTIQTAIDAALDGDIVLVSDGTYKGEGNKNLDFKGKAITVRSENGPDSTIIDCEGEGRGFHFHNGEGNNSILSGFKITNGYADGSGAGIRIYSSSRPTIENCIISKNSATMWGGGIECYSYITNPSPLSYTNINHCTIIDNEAKSGMGLLGSGGGISCINSSVNINNCTISGNFADQQGGGIYYGSSLGNISKCTITRNFADQEGGGIWCHESVVNITNCIINKNSATSTGGGIFCDEGVVVKNCTISRNSAVEEGGGVSCSAGSPEITNCIIWGNTPDEIYQDINANPIFKFCDIHGEYSGEGNFYGDPLFVDAKNDDYHLSISSPCIYAATSAYAPDTDIEGNLRPQGYGYDIGAYEATGYDQIRPIIESFKVNRTESHVPFEVTFVCDARDPDGEIEDYTIDYGDGSPPANNTIGVFTHMYTTEGMSYATCTVTDDTGISVNSFSIRIRIIEVPSAEEILNIFGMEFGNRWTYAGTYQDLPFSIEREITSIDQSSFPVPTYLFEIKENGSIVGTEWYENTGNQIKLWGTTGEYEGSSYTFKFSEGLTAAWFPMKVNDHVYSSTTTQINGYSFNVSLMVDVINKATITLAFDTVEAYKVSYQLRVWGTAGIDITDSFTWWMVPYLGIVKDQRSDTLTELTSFAIGGGIITQASDNDEDNLSDYDEFFIYNTHWLLADTDFDDCEDGWEVQYGLDPLVNDASLDKDSDGFTNLQEYQAGTDPTDPNSKPHAPTADAGPDQTVDQGVTVTLDGSNSSDPDDGITSYQWIQTAGTSVTLSDTTAVKPTFTSPDVGTNGEDLIFELTVTDNGGLQDTDTCIVFVSPVISSWYLISLSKQPTDKDIADVLNSISGKYVSVWAYIDGSWKVYDPNNPGFSDLTTMEAGRGYWINMTEYAALSVTGSTPSKSIDLQSGWNLVGYNSSTSQSVTDALASMTEKFISIWAYMDGSWKVYDPNNPGFSDLTTMEPGYGYWINATEACTWTLP